jgi:molecular chaperone DnaK
MNASGNVEVIPNKEGQKTTPSVVAFTKTGEKLVGVLAKRQAVTNPDGTVVHIKRKMGSDYKVTVNGKSYTPQQISAFILQKLKEDAEDYLGEPIKDAVITVPAYFNDAQRQATKDAGTIAGLNVIRIINEPTAAALCAGQGNKIDGTVMVIDSGEGTTDITIMDVSDGVYEVVGTSGDNFLGGADWDKVIADYIVAEFKKSDGVDLSSDKMAMQRIIEAAEKAKIELSTMPETTISLPFITANQDGPKHLEVKLTKAKFEELSSELVARFEKPIKQVLADTKLSPSDIEQVLFVGGSSRLPMLQAKVKEIMGKDALKNTNPDEAISVGATIQGSIITGDSKSDIVLVDVTPLSLGIETMGEMNTILIEKNSAIPISKKQVFTTAVDNQPAVTIKILQGERAKSKDNHVLGTFNLDGILPAPAHTPQIEVSFDIDTNGILSVSAKDLGTNKEQHITVQNSNLSKDEIERMKNEAERFADEDKKAREGAGTKNEAESFKFTVEKMLKDNADIFEGTEKADIEAKIKELNDALAANDIETIKTKKDELMKVVQPVSERIYSKAQQANGSSGATPNFSAEDLERAKAQAGASTATGATPNFQETDNTQQ